MIKELEDLKELFERYYETDEGREQYLDKLEEVDALVRKLTHRYFASAEFQDEFNNIADLRYYMFQHPNQEMIKLSCLWFLGLDEIHLKWIEHSKTIINDTNRNLT